MIGGLLFLFASITAMKIDASFVNNTRHSSFAGTHQEYTPVQAKTQSKQTVERESHSSLNPEPRKCL
ncbi:hypothetical protein evm_001320 [Chilo suppressalis]|nr:hypothetical protein evm_001320 [Chilo suppressalis]